MLVLTGEALQRWLADAPEPCSPHIVVDGRHTDRDGIRWFTVACSVCKAVLDIHDERIARQRAALLFTQVIEADRRPRPPPVTFVSPSMWRWLTAHNIKSGATTSVRVELNGSDDSADALAWSLSAIRAGIEPASTA